MVEVDAAAAAKLLADQSETVVLDIRTAEEFAQGHLEGAVNIDFKATDFRQKLAELDPKKSYLMHCRSGGRSSNALPIFAELGFDRLHHLSGGILDWQEAGQKIVQ